MSKPERFITMGGMYILLPVFTYLGLLFGGDVGMGIGFVLALVTMMGLKAWAWRHTEYEDGWESARWTWNPDNEE